MPKNIQNKIARNDPTPSRQTTRLFIEVPGVGWKPVSCTWGSIIRPKNLCLPELAGKTVRAALASISMVNRKPATLNQLRIEHWLIGGDGNPDMDDQVRHVVARFHLTMRGGNDPGVTSEDVDEIKQHLGIISPS
jgi:hypothetical protein